MASKQSAGIISAVGALLIATAASGQTPATGRSPASDFVPDHVFSGSQLTGFTTVGQAQWRAANGEIIGRSTGPAGGWLIMDRSYQDVVFFSNFQCGTPCRTGILVRTERTPQGMSGIYVSLSDGDLLPYRLTVDAQGRELSRERLGRAPTQLRVATAENTPPPAAPPPASGVGGSSGANAAATGSATGTRAGPIPPARITLPALQPPPADVLKGQWNSIVVLVEANILRPNLNGGNQIGTGDTGDVGNGYGPIALWVGPGSEVRFRDVATKDLGLRTITPEAVSSRFRMQQLDPFFRAWDATAADINRDGVQDIVAGPYYFLGPDYTQQREIYIAPSFSPSMQYPRDMVTHAHDWTGDGWPDVLSTEGRQMVLHVNPRGENRRWTRHLVLPGVTTELTVMEDVDADGRPEIVYAIGGVLAYAKYDPANPTEPWAVHRVSDTGVTYAHSVGVGDINGDGRADILQTAGWWEQPAQLNGQLWTYHPVEFGRWSRSEGAGGGRIAAWDVNGDGLNDVVTSLNAHGWGLAWFQQKRDAQGNISFERHMIMDDFTTANAGGATFSELHAGVVPADIDGDGMMDFVTGKRHWAHRESYTDPDPHGDAVVYWYRATRNASAPGGIEFVPELVHNRSGVGSLFKVLDLNNDGAQDILTSANRGTFVFWGTPRRP